MVPVRARATFPARLPTWAGPVVVAGLAAAILIRLILLPTDGFRDDLDQFVGWVRDIGRAPFGQAYRLDLSFPPVMAYLFALMGGILGLAGHAVDAGDPLVRAVVKLPASVADLALALGVAFALRDRLRWAIVAGLAIALHPALIYVSAWWGQFESIYVLAGLVAVLLAGGRHPNLAAVALGVAVMTKPQALPFFVPFAAWAVARFGLGGAIRLAAVTAGTAAVLWVPFLADGGVAGYARNLNHYQNEVFGVLSLRAWNVWWLLQQAAGGNFLSDSGALLGPVSVRSLAFVMTGLAEAVVFIAVYQRPTFRNLVLGIAASALVAFSLLTTMHERYAFAALVFLALLLPEVRLRALWLVFGLAFTANLMSAVPATAGIAQLLPQNGLLSVLGAVTVLAVTLGSVWQLTHGPAESDSLEWSDGEHPPQPASEGNPIPAQVVR